MITLIESNNSETMLDYRGITIVPSGTAPHNPEQARIVYRNSAPRARVRTEISDAAAAAAERGQAALDAWAATYVKPVRRSYMD